MNTRVILSVSLAAALGGCATYGSPEAGNFDKEDFGEANRMTYAAMVVDPDPEYSDEMEGSGDRAAQAVKAYREGKVEEPRRVNSTRTSGGGGGGS